MSHPCEPSLHGWIVGALLGSVDGGSVGSEPGLLLGSDDGVLLGEPLRLPGSADGDALGTVLGE